jgi:hypothetical protein
MLIISALKRLRQDDNDFEDSLEYIDKASSPKYKNILDAKLQIVLKIQLI